MSKRATVKKRSGKEEPVEEPIPEDENQKDDDRNLKLVDEDFDEAEFDEKLWLFWKKYKGSIYFIVVIALGGLLGYLGMKKMEQADQESLQNAYLESLDGDAEGFIAQYGDTVLGGVALLSLADEKYAVAEYSAAAEKYKSAIKPLRNTLLGSRARIGYAISSYYNDDNTSARKSLQEVLEDGIALESHKAEALYHLGVIETELKNFEEAKRHFKALEENDSAGSWLSKVELLKSSYPELADIELESESAEATEEPEAKE